MERETNFLLHNPLKFFKNGFSGEFYFKDFIDLLEFFNKDGLFYSNNNKKVIKKKGWHMMFGILKGGLHIPGKFSQFAPHRPTRSET